MPRAGTVAAGIWLLRLTFVRMRPARGRRGGMRHYPALDGLRGVAVLGVVLAHTGTPLVGGGRGVDIFFVLSGYLITAILLRDPPLTDFYVRRARRLLPALLTFLAAYVAFGGLLLPDDHRMIEAASSLSYVQNWTMVAYFRRSGLAHTWSLSVEEQFYLMWPFLLYFVRKSTIPRAWLAGSWVLLTILRFMWPITAPAAYYSTPLHATGLILGSLIAFKLPSDKFGWPALAAIVACFALGGVSQGVWPITLAEIGAAFLIPALLKPSRLSAALSYPALQWIGLISYGLYLWHAPFALAFRGHWWAAPITLLISIPIAALSYYTVEALFRVNRAVRPTLHTPVNVLRPSG